MSLSRLSIRLKLLLLAGVPVIGALLLALLIAKDARERAATAAALGSIEDIAHLSESMSRAMHAMQLERTRAAMSVGFAAKPEDAGRAKDLLARQYTDSDAALAELDQFLDGRDLSKLPTRLARDLQAAREQTALRTEFRAKVGRGEASFDEILAFYGKVSDSLVSATGALTQLSDDGDILRSISSLVAVSQLGERASREHALLGNVFAAGQFPAGGYKTLVTLISEEDIYAEVFRANAADEQTKRYEQSLADPVVAQAMAMRKKALDTTEETIEGDPTAWFDAESGRLAHFAAIEGDLTARIAAAAKHKIAATQKQIRIGMGLCAAVLVLSAILAFVIGRNITRPILSLASAAAKIQETKDFGVRAEKSTHDELGAFTDTFNEMLHGLQERDRELEAHRTTLEEKVAARTQELAARNEAMRLVLDNVDQGLATIKKDGTLDTERSSAIDRWLGAPADGVHFGDHVSPEDYRIRDLMKMSWDMCVEGLLPLDVALGQLPSSVVIGESSYTFGFKPITHGDDFDGALLIMTDVTAEVAQRREHEKQREQIAIFERLTQDKEGFLHFAADLGALVDRLKAGITEEKTAMIVLHTIKGGAAQWGITSVAHIAHELETKVVDEHEIPTAETLAPLYAAWEAIEARVKSFAGKASHGIELAPADFAKLVDSLHRRVAHETIAREVERLKHERVETRFERMDADLARLAERVEKPIPKVVIEGNDVRLPASKFGSFWASTVHLLRNMMDHGLEDAAGRIAAGKSEVGTITLRAETTRDHFVISFGDDGRGIQWERVREKALAAGLPVETRADLERALFGGGVSTAAAVSDVSGRGVGVSAVVERCEALGGTIRIESTLGQGTRFVFSFPRHQNEHSIVPVRLAS